MGTHIQYTVTCEMNLYNLKRIKDSWKYQVNRKHNWHLQSKKPVRKNSEALKFQSWSDTAWYGQLTFKSWCLEKAGWRLCPVQICSHTDVSEYAIIYPTQGCVITTRHDVKQGSNLQWMGRTFPSFSKAVVKLNNALQQTCSRRNHNSFLAAEISHLH